MAMCSETIEYAMATSDLKCEVCHDEPSPYVFVVKGMERVFNACETHEPDVECRVNEYTKDNGGDEYGRIQLAAVGTFKGGMFAEILLTEYEVE